MSDAPSVPLAASTPPPSTRSARATLGRPLAVLLRLLRSGAVGALATLCDLAILGALVSLAGVSPRIASVPALLAGNVVAFFGQRHFTFRAGSGDGTRQLTLFALVQAGGFALTALLYDGAMDFVPLARAYYVPARLVVTNVVWLAYSFPVWHWVFRRSASPPPSAPR